jgi:hypothetical protein
MGCNIHNYGGQLSVGLPVMSVCSSSILTSGYSWAETGERDHLIVFRVKYFTTSIMFATGFDVTV